jgi:FSR family fosmidomycin resistance protein-like MFS transporter
MPLGGGKLMKNKNKQTLAVIAFAHFTIDWFPAYLTPLLPVIKEHYGLTIGQTTMIPAILGFASAFAQPFFGSLSDKFKSRIFMILAVLITGFSMSSIGLVGSFLMLMVLLLIGRLSNAAFHPEAATFIGELEFKKSGIAMSSYTFAGQMAVGLSPLFISYMYKYFGLVNIFYSSLLALVASALLIKYLPKRASPEKHKMKKSSKDFFRSKNFRFILIIITIVTIRSSIGSTFKNLIPIYYASLGMQITVGGIFLAANMFFGALGNLTGGFVTDKLGNRWNNVISFSIMIPIIIAFVFSKNLYLSLAIFSIFGFVSSMSIASNVVYVQKLFPYNRGLATSMVTGVAWGLSGAILIFMGNLADKIGIMNTFVFTIALTLLGLGMSFYLKDENKI